MAVFGSLLAGLNGLIMIAIGLAHLYWLFGGKWGYAEIVPTDDAGKRVLHPGPVSTVIVSVGLLAFAGYYFARLSGMAQFLPLRLGSWGIWALGFLFLARAIGDFRYMGFFKKVRNTVFGRQDTRYFAPLCLYLSISSFLIAIFK